MLPPLGLSLTSVTLRLGEAVLLGSFEPPASLHARHRRHDFLLFLLLRGSQLGKLSEARGVLAF